MASSNSYTGYALVVNVKYFEDPDNNREETVSDQINVLEAFSKFGFNTKLVTDSDRHSIVPVPTDSTEVNVTVKHFKREFKKALQHVNEQGYGHFAVFISTHGEEVREGDHYIHKLSFYDGDESTEEILFKPLVKKLNRKVKKLVIIQACRSRDDQCNGEYEDRGVLVHVEDKKEENQSREDPTEENQSSEDPAEEYQSSEDPAEEYQSSEDPAEEYQSSEDPAEEYQSSEDPAEEYHSSEDPAEEYQSKAETVHCVPLCIPNCITMFASPSEKAAYQRHLADLLLKTVKTFKSRENVNVLELMRKVNRQFAEMDLDMEYDDENGCRCSYDVKNIGSIVHCLTEHIVYPITK